MKFDFSEATCLGQQSDNLKLLDSIEALCQRRKELGSIPWDAKSARSRNALTEIKRIDGLIVEKVLELYDYKQLGRRMLDGWLDGFQSRQKIKRVEVVIDDEA